MHLIIIFSADSCSLKIFLRSWESLFYPSDPIHPKNSNNSIFCHFSFNQSHQSVPFWSNNLIFTFFPFSPGNSTSSPQRRRSIRQYGSSLRDGETAPRTPRGYATGRQSSCQYTWKEEYYRYAYFMDRLISFGIEMVCVMMWKYCEAEKKKFYYFSALCGCRRHIIIMLYDCVNTSQICDSSNRVWFAVISHS